MTWLAQPEGGRMAKYPCCECCAIWHEGTSERHANPCPQPECGQIAPSKDGGYVAPTKANREGDQPLPIPNDGPYIQHLVQIDLIARQQLGESRYGVPGLQPHNGRDMLRDAYDEALDLCVYLRGVIHERDNPQ